MTTVTATILDGQCSVSCDACDWTAESDADLFPIRDAEHHVWRKHGGGMLRVADGWAAIEVMERDDRIGAIVREWKGR